MSKKKLIKPTLGNINTNEPWNALITDQVVGQGQSATDAAMIAKNNRPTERHQLIYFDTGETPPLPFPGVVSEITEAWPQTLGQAWIDGETIARTLRKQKLTQFGLIVAGELAAVYAHLAEALPLELVGSITTERLMFTLESNYQVYTFTLVKQQGADIVAHLLQEEMTFEAMAVGLNAPHRFLDPAHGVADMRNGVLKRLATGTDVKSGAVVNYLRMAMALGVQLHADTKAYVKTQIDAPPVAADYRHLLLALGDGKPSIVLRTLAVLGGLETKFPDLAKIKASGDWEITLRTLDSLTGLLSVLHRIHDVDSASEFAFGLVSARIGRFRIRISDFIEQPTPSGYTYKHLLFLAGLLSYATDAKALVAELDLSNEELQFVRTLLAHKRRLAQIEVADWTPELGNTLIEQMSSTGALAPLLMLGLKHAEWTPAIPHTEWADLITVCVAFLEQFHNNATER